MASFGDRSWRYTAILMALSFGIAACGNPAGTPCRTVGSGFHARHDCRHRCLSRWHVTCPSGERVLPNACSGSFGCTPGRCPDGQVCYHDDDPFDDRSFCVMSTTCGQLSKDKLASWEHERVRIQQQVREKRAEKEARRARWRAENPGATTATPVDPRRP